jgi:hypothetical protein
MKTRKARAIATLAVAASVAAIAQAQVPVPAQKTKPGPFTAPPAIVPVPAPPAPPIMVPGPPAPPPQPANSEIHALRPAFVPLVALPLDTTQASDPIWIKGDRPASSVVARMTLRPLETVVVEQNVGQGTGKKLILLRALAGDQTRYRSVADAGGAKQRIYCADAPALHDSGRIPCFEDREGDGMFESRVFGLGESGDKAEQLSILARAIPMAVPVRYRPAAADEVGDIPVAIVNCRKGHERPAWRMSPGSAPGQNALELALGATPPANLTPEQEAQRRSELNNAIFNVGGNCEASERVREGEPLHPGTLPKGAAVARLGELVIQIGSKDEGAPVRLLGLRDPNRLYRRSFGPFVPASDAPTFKQKSLALEQKFDRPVLVTAGTAQVEEGRRSVGDTILTIGFRHGYMGVLTEDTVIRTLFSKRSLPKGSVLYGVPMSYSTTLSYGGKPLNLPTISGGAPDPDAVRLVWCVPVQDEAQWTATCLPHQGAADRYTLLKGQKPAFEVTGFTFAANQASNPGSVPVEMQDGDFGRPLSWRFRIKEIAPAGIVLTQETMFGDEMVSGKDIRLPRIAGQVSALGVSGGILVFEEIEGAADSMTVKTQRPVRIGSEPRVEPGLLKSRLPAVTPEPFVPPSPSS